jgi:hypothetical protein
MLKPLGDPFTRFLPPKVADAFENQREGRVSGPADRAALPAFRCQPPWRCWRVQWRACGTPGS